jgi:SpoVK/Ycf46/Vps4 family AAA+-type ATPase
MSFPSKLARDLTETSRTINFKDPQIRSLMLSLGTRALALVGSMVFSYFLIRYALKHLDPTHEEKKRQKELAEIISQKMNLPRELVNNFNEYEMCLLADLINPIDIQITWQDIGGLNEIIDHVRQTVIYPLQHPELFNQSKLLTTPKGVLLYGPPGCGKTMLAKAIAREAGANFINLQVTSLLDKWYGESQKRTAAIFSLAKKLQPSIIFIDEIDSFMRTRQNDDHECTRMVKTQFMTLWDGLETDANDPTSNRILIIGATNRAQDLDAAILRRMPSRYHIPLPNLNQRIKIFELILANEQLHTDVDLEQLGQQTTNYTGSDINEICRQAAMQRIVELCNQQSIINEENSLLELRPINQADFLEALKKVRDSHHHHQQIFNRLTLD